MEKSPELKKPGFGGLRELKDLLYQLKEQVLIMAEEKKRKIERIRDMAEKDAVRRS